MTVTRPARATTDRPPRARSSTTSRGLVEALRTAFHRSAIDGGGTGGRGRVLRRHRGDAVGSVAGGRRRQRWRPGRLQRRRPHLVHRHVRGGDRVGERPAHRRHRQRHRPGHRGGRDAAAGVGARHPHGHARSAEDSPRSRRCGSLAGSAWPPIVGGGPPRPATLVLVAPSLVLAITANLFAQHAVAASRLLDPRCRVDLVPLHEGGVHPRRDDHPARAAARRAAARSRCSCRSERWRTCRRAWRRATGSLAPAARAAGWIGVLAVGGRRWRSAPASGDSRWSADERGEESVSTSGLTP